MKHLFFLLLCAAPVLGMSAQQSSRSISESTSDTKYSLRIKSSDFTAAELIDAFNEVTGNGLSQTSRGTFTWTSEEGTAVEINTRRKTFVVRSEQSSSGSKYGKRAKKALNFVPPPPPPAID